MTTLAEPHSEGHLTPGRFALFLAVLVVASFPAVLLAGHPFVIRDFSLFSYPAAHFQREAFWHGQLPLWNPFNYCGIPFLAQWNTMSLYPPALLYLLLPLTWSLPFFCLAHLFWGGLGMYLLARRWTSHGLAAAVAGIIFAFNGLTLNLLMWPSHIATFSWLPWLLYLAPEAWREGGTRLVWATLAGAMQMLAGGPETILLTWLVLFLLACGDGLRQEVPARRVFLRLFGMAGWVALVCAAQLLPFLALAFHSQRDAGFGSSGWSMPPWGWANFLVPLFHSSPTPQGVFFQEGQYWTSSYYAGIGTLLFVAVAVWRVPRWRVRLLAGLLLLALLLALGDAGLLYRGLRFCLPGLGFVRYPVKFVLLVLALAPLLAALGLRALLSRPRTMGFFEWTCAVLLLALIGIITYQGQKLSADQQLRQALAQNALVRAAFFIALVVLVAAFSRAFGRLRVALGWLMLTVFWLDFVTHVPVQNPSVRPAVYSPAWAGSQRKWEPQPKLGGTRAMPSAIAQAALKFHVLPELQQNFLLNRLGLLADCNLLEDIPSAYGFFSLVPEEINNATLLPYIQTNPAPAALLDFMAVSQITAPDKVSDWAARPTAMPLVTAGQQPVFVDDRSAFAALGRTNIDFRRVVLLPLEARNRISATQQPAARVRVPEFGSQRVTFHTEAPAPAVVVVSQTYYAPWTALIDGRPGNLWRANYAFQAVQVPAGKHTVQLVYRDRAFLAGALLSGLGLVSCVVFWMRAHFKSPFVSAHHSGRLGPGLLTRG